MAFKGSVTLSLLICGVINIEMILSESEYVRLPRFKGKSSKYTLTLEKFDNSSYIYSSTRFMNSSTNLPDELEIDCFGMRITRIILPAEEYKDLDVKKFTFSDEGSLPFSCIEYLNFFLKFQQARLYIVVTQNNHMRVFDRPTYNLMYTKEHDGLMICCLVFIVRDEGDSKHIVRHVLNKTVLAYDPSLKTEIKNPIKITFLIKETIPNPTTSAVALMSSPTISSTTNPTITTDGESKDTKENTNIIILSVTGVTVIFVTVIAILLIKKRCWTKSDPAQRPQLPINDDPFYLNMLFRRECDQEIEAAEQHFYEEIK